MAELRYPNESEEYRVARDELLEEEKALVEKTKAVAELRRKLPPGGKLKEDYEFQWAVDGKVGESVKLSELFGDKDTLLIYNLMYGPSWDNPCLSCTSLVDGFDRAAYQVNHDATFVVVTKASAEKLHAWAKKRGWSEIGLISAFENPYLEDYKCQGENDDMVWPILHVFKKQDGEIYHFWGTELQGNHVDTVWPYWNLMDLTPEGRPDRDTPPQNFRSKFLEDNFLNQSE